MSVGTDQAPYRTPCDGTYHAPRYAVGSCYQHKRASERNIPMYRNVTEAGDPPATGFPDHTWGPAGNCGTIANPASGPNRNCFATVPVPTGVLTDGSAYAAGVDAIEIKAAGSGNIVVGASFTIAGDSTTYTALSKVTLPGGPEYTLTFSPVLAVAIPAEETAVTFLGTDTCVRDYSLCHKQGWKAVRAQKAWHGRYSMTSLAQAQDCAGGHCDADGTRYCTVAKSVDASLAIIYDETTYHYTLNQDQTTSVGKHTGIVTLDDWDWTWTALDGGSDPDPTVDFMNVTAKCGLFNQASLDMAVAVDTSAGPGANGNPNYNFEPFGLAGWLLISKSITATTATFTLASPTDQETYVTDWIGSLTFTMTLSNTYLFTTVVEEIYGLLALWDLTDDVVYPWRTDTSCSSVPMVQYGESSAAKTPDVGWQCGTWPPSGCSWQDPDDVDLADGMPQYDGDIYGAPLPGGYTSGGANNNGSFYAFRMVVGGQYGHWAPSKSGPGETSGYLPDTMTWWNYDTAMPDGAFFWHNNGTVTAQKWAVIKDSMPSINFFRPCGADRDTVGFEDAWPICGHIAISGSEESGGTVTVTLSEDPIYLEVDDWVRFVKYDSSYARTELGLKVQVTDVNHGNKTFSYSGSLPDATATHVISYNNSTAANAPHYRWYNDTAKGDFVKLDWTTTTNSDCTTTDDYTCTTGCILRTPCAPSVICITPNDEQFENAVEYGFPDQDPNVYWNAIALPDIPDPFGTPDVRTEARCAVPTVPTGCPALHSGVTIPCSGGDCLAPTQDGSCYEGGVWV